MQKPEPEDTPEDKHIREFLKPLDDISEQDIPQMIQCLAVMLSGIDYRLRLLQHDISQLSKCGSGSRD